MMNKTFQKEKNKTMLILFVRSIIIFIFLLIIVRLMGKRQIGEMQPFELVITLILADLATIPMADASIPLVYGIVGILTLFILHQILTLIDRYCSPLSDVISGTPSIVINSKGVNFKEIKKQNMSVDDLLESIRSAGYASLDHIAFAVFEANGKVSVLPKTTKELSENEDKTALPIIFIVCGKYEEHKLQILNLDKQTVHKIFGEHNIQIKDVELATIDQFGKIYVQEKNKGYQVIHCDYKGGNIW